ncbi:unnamed protein product [Brassica oleracea]
MISSIIVWTNLLELASPTQQLINSLVNLVILEKPSVSTEFLHKVEINDDTPESKPSLEELDALEVKLASLSSLGFIHFHVTKGSIGFQHLSNNGIHCHPRRLTGGASSKRVRHNSPTQLELVESYQLAVENLGTHLNPRLQILPRQFRSRALCCRENKGRLQRPKTLFIYFILCCL